MQKVILTFIGFFILIFSFGQTQKKVPTYLFVQYNNTIQDITKGNNPWGAGLGFQTFFNNKTKFKPTVELTADIYLLDDKVYRIGIDGEVLNDCRGMVNLFFGTSFHPTKIVFLSLLAGPSFVGGQTLFGIKPSLCFYLSKTQKWTTKISYINIFNRGKIVKQNFESISLAVGFKLF